MGVESILKSVSDSAGQDDSGNLRRPHTDDAVPTSAAAIPHQSLTHATLKAPWLTSFVWMSVAAGAGMLGAAAAAAAAWPVALVAAAVAGVASARVILKRRRQITVRGDRLVEDTGWGSRELRLSEVRLIQQGRRFIQKARDPLSAASLSFKSDDASISFADLKPEGAHEVATAVLQIVAPRLLEQCPRRQGTTRDDKGRLICASQEHPGETSAHLVDVPSVSRRRCPCAACWQTREMRAAHLDDAWPRAP